MRQFQITLNDKAIQRVVDDLDLKKEVTFRLGFDAMAGTNLAYILTEEGALDPSKHHICIQRASMVYEGPPRLSTFAVQRKMRFSVLHELRHAYQHEYWEPGVLIQDGFLPYNMQKTEADANQYAQENLERFKDVLTCRENTPRRRLP